VADSPFSGPGYSIYLETFEDGLLNTPGVSASGGSVVNGQYVDSVDGDDGVIDGNGSTQGHSWYSNFVLGYFTFTFDANVLGSLPTVAGLVWTDVGFNSLTPYYGNFTFEAFGPGGFSLGSSGPYYLGDGQDAGQASDDRFFGVSDSDGISAITIRTIDSADWEVDHLQYGALSPLRETLSPVPEPGSLTLLGIGVVGLLREYRRRARSKDASVI